MIKSYRELILLPTFEERFAYLKIGGVVGRETFGFNRWINQMFYNSKEYKLFRRDMIVRDGGCDLGISDREIYKGIILHHINPITVEDVMNSEDCLFDPDNVICTVHNTHNAIHFGDESLLIRLPNERKKGDTTLWRTRVS